MTNHELRELVSKGIKGKYGDDITVSLNQAAEIFTMIDNILIRNDWYLGDPVKASGFMNIITELCVQSGGEGDNQFTIHLDKFKELFKPEELPIVYIGFECPDYIKRAMLEEKELQIRYNKLDKFLNSDKTKDLSPKELSYMEDQRAHMYQYMVSLQGRIDVYRKKATEPVNVFDKEAFVNGLEDIKELLYKNIGEVKNGIANSDYVDKYTVKIDNATKLLSIHTTQYILAIEKAIKTITE
ncbi:hypothetical protein JDFnp1_127 [Fusobacterium phage JD-Fnp1]|nr:hypothetical protein JDFnp1_127 [Fusobacterium phage JD-Fnp1]